MSIMYKQHQDRWKCCTACPLHEVRRHVVLARFTVLPTEVLFIGEGPGSEEDRGGRPFIGVAGRLMQTWIDRAHRVVPFHYALTNVVACRPADWMIHPVTHRRHRGGRTPTTSEKSACSGRLIEFICDVARPKAIVAVGGVAAQWLESDKIATYIEGYYKDRITHPAAYLRRQVVPPNVGEDEVDQIIRAGLIATNNKT